MLRKINHLPTARRDLEDGRFRGEGARASHRAVQVSVVSNDGLRRIPTACADLGEWTDVCFGACCSQEVGLQHVFIPSLIGLFMDLKKVDDKAVCVEVDLA